MFDDLVKKKSLSLKSILEFLCLFSDTLMMSYFPQLSATSWLKLLSTDQNWVFKSKLSLCALIVVSLKCCWITQHVLDKRRRIFRFSVDNLHIGIHSSLKFSFSRNVSIHLSWHQRLDSNCAHTYLLWSDCHYLLWNDI